MKVFLDSNVLISAFVSDGLSSALFDELLLEHEIVLSPQVLNEFRRITLEKFHADQIEIDGLLLELEKNALISSPPYEETMYVRDPNDVEILAAALKSNAPYLVTGDKDLLSVATDGIIAIVTPREMSEILNLHAK